MRLGPFLVVLLVMYLMIGILDNVLDPTMSNWKGNSGKGISYFDIIFQPYVWSENEWLVAIAAAIGAISVIIGATAFVTRSDIVALSGLAGIFLAMAVYPLLSLYSFITRNVGQFVGCIPGQTCPGAWIIGSLTAGVIALMYTMTVIEWWFWRPTTQ